MKSNKQKLVVDIFNILELIAVCDASPPLLIHFSRYVVLSDKKKRLKQKRIN